jgi:hypothetical protein
MANYGFDVDRQSEFNYITGAGFAELLAMVIYGPENSVNHLEEAINAGYIDPKIVEIDEAYTMGDACDAIYKLFAEHNFYISVFMLGTRQVNLNYMDGDLIGVLLNDNKLYNGNDNNVSDTMLLAGYIAIDGNMLYLLEEVEVLMLIDDETNAVMEINPSEIAVRLNDRERMAELGLTEGDFPNYYYIHSLSNEMSSYELTDETVYTFTDINLLFVDDENGSREYSTTNVDEFIQHLKAFYNDGIPPYILYVPSETRKAEAAHIQITDVQ